ncbi:MAG: NUDIX domain-containing protein [Chloroflexia bacterium]|nr:NUDIX domain-containing protein [Chloroflexia bacterium]
MSGVPRVGVAVIVEKEGQVLLLRRHNVHGTGTWSTPGGHLDWGESPEDCAVREAYEETGVRIGEVRFLAITNDVFEAEGKHYVTLWMQGRYLSGEPSVQAAHEMSEVGWFPWEALPQPLFLPLQHLLEGQCDPPGSDLLRGKS